MNIFQKIENAMMAAAFAEAGEHTTALECLRPLKTSNKKVLLGADMMEISPRILDHATSLCQRLGASLEIFHLLPPEILHGTVTMTNNNLDVRPLTPLKERLARAGINYQCVVREARLEDELTLMSAKRREILLVVIASRLFGQGCDWTSLFQRFKCPVAVLEP